MYYSHSAHKGYITPYGAQLNTHLPDLTIRESCKDHQQIIYKEYFRGGDTS